MFSLNRAEIVGNITRDPEMRYTPNGQAVCSFGVATNRRWRDKEGNNQEQTEFHNIVAWGKVAELMSQLTHKGTKIYVEGRLQTRQWEGQDGNKRNRTEIVMEDFIVLTPKGAIPAREPEADEKVTIEDFPAGKEKEDEEKPKKEEPHDKSSKKDKESDAAEDEINLDEIPF